MIFTPKPLPLYLSLVAAIILQLIPLPDFVADARPLWLPMTVLFWSINMPAHFNIGSAWVIGLLLDLITGSLMGQHALAMITMSYIGIRLYKQYRLYSILQRLLLVFAALLAWQLIDSRLWGLSGHAPTGWAFWLPLISSLVLWTWYQGLLSWVDEHWRGNLEARH